jgi:Tfp pilus assembly protein PilF
MTQDSSSGAIEGRLRAWLEAHPTDAAAHKQLGDLYFRLSRHEEAETQFARALELAPDFAAARWMLAGTFAYRGNWAMALSTTQALLRDNPEKAAYIDIEAYALLQLGEFEPALARYDALRAKYPTAENWKSYGRALKAVGRTAEAIHAYRQALALKPDYGMAWWSLAELKTCRLELVDVAAIEKALENKDQSAQNRALLHFALARTHEDAQQYETAFEQYRRANAAVHSTLRHDPKQRAGFVRRNKSVFTPAYFDARAGWGSLRGDPIFIVGLPRSGSTLLEQILASHSQVEPTAELQALESVIRERSHKKGRKYPELMEDLSAGEMLKAGEEYLARAAAYRKLNRPFFIDKMPNNFSYLGALLTCLPDAKIIDARRHPLGSGFAIFKHYFVEAYSFAFDLADIGRYYRDYVELMAHFDVVRPGRVHRVFHENMIADPQREIRRLLAYCGLPFEEQCLRFDENARAILTPSSEQVRRPIAAEATALWRRYDRWLEPLKSALGDALDRYPEVPEFPPEPVAASWEMRSRSHPDNTA